MPFPRWQEAPSSLSPIQAVSLLDWGSAASPLSVLLGMETISPEHRGNHLCFFLPWGICSGPQRDSRNPQVGLLLGSEYRLMPSAVLCASVCYCSAFLWLSYTIRGAFGNSILFLFANMFRVLCSLLAWTLLSASTMITARLVTTPAFSLCPSHRWSSRGSRMYPHRNRH